MVDGGQECPFRSEGKRTMSVARTMGVLLCVVGQALCAAQAVPEAIPLEGSSGIEIRANPLILPSVRKERIEVRFLIDNLQDKPRRLSVAARITDCKTGEEACTPRRARLVLPKGFSGEKSFVLRVKNLACWSPENPQQYFCNFEIREGEGLLASIPRVKFGYREVWAEGGKLLLNGKRLFAAGKSHNYLKGYGFRREELELLRQSGQMADRTGRPPDEEQFATLDVTDEFGWLVFMCEVPMGDESPTRHPPSRERRSRFGGVASFGDGAGRELLYKIGNHPSVISWTQWGNGYVNGPHGHPMQIGGVVPKSVRRGDEIYERMRECKRIDPSRTCGYYRLGAGGEYRGIMSDLGFGAPVQTMEEWLSYWAEHKPAPFFPMEFALMRIHEYSLWQRRSGECGLVEQCARYFGEHAYSRLPDDVLTAAYAPGASNIDVVGAVKYSDLLFDLKELCYTRAVRAWRTYGISGYLLHVDGKRDFTHTDGQLNRWGETLANVSSPILFYLGGPQEDFVSKDHSFFSGEKITKSAILINDTLDDVAGTIAWELREVEGDVLHAGSREVTVKQGGVFFLALEFTAPTVTRKTRLALSATYTDQATGTLHRDEFEIEVFPRAETTWPGEPVLLIDSHGDTGAMLEGLGVRYELLSAKARVDPSAVEGHRLLVIGRNSYGEAVEVFRTWPQMRGTGAATAAGGDRHPRPTTAEVLEFVEQGLNVICLEQMNRHVMGLKVENFNTREVFVRAKDSPLFDGLSNEDFRDWRGESTLLPAYPPWNPESDWEADKHSKHGQRNAFEQMRYWHWSNRGMVATFCFEKPQVGNFQVLLDNGFDLLYTPLIEFRHGKGRILLSQLDMVDHCDTDPVARLLFQRMLREYSRAAAHPPSPVAYIGGADVEAVLQQLRAESTEGFNGDVVFLLPGETELSSDQVKNVRMFVEGGGTLLTCLENEEQASVLPVDVGLENRSIRRAEFPDDPVFSGLGMSELFWRQAVDLPALARLGGRDASVSAGGLAGVTRFGQGRIVLLQIDPGLFTNEEQAWQRSKVLRIYATVFTNLGVKSSAALDLCAISGMARANEWLPGYAPAEESGPEAMESDQYVVEALDFDPDEHHVW